jgi:hypothetical protein
MDEPVATGYDPLVDDELGFARTIAASEQQRIAFGTRAGQQVRRMGSGFGYEGESPTLNGTRCASVNGFSLHANTQVPVHRCDQLERLLRYTVRGAVSLERLERDANGDLLYTFAHPWSDGTTGIKLSPVEFLETLAALELGAAAEARLYDGHGTLSRASAGHVTDHYRDYPGKRHPEDPAASKAGSGSAIHCVGASSRVCVGLLQPLIL